MSNKTSIPGIGASSSVIWTDPHGLVSSDARVFLYFVRVTDNMGHEYRYIGQTTNGKKRLTDYPRNVRRIFAGLPRRTTPGQENYRAVHFALATARRHGWQYEFYPLEEVELGRLNQVEQQRIRELQCNLNGASNWRVEQFNTLTLRELVGEPAASPLSPNDQCEWTGAQLSAARLALQSAAESSLGRVLFAYAGLESALDLCIVWVGEGRDLESRTCRIERLNFAGKLQLLADDVQRLATSESAVAYRGWLARAHVVRERRNMLAHGRLGLEVRSNKLIVVLSRATSTTQRSLEFSLAELDELVAESDRLIHDLSDLRSAHPL